MIARPRILALDVASTTGICVGFAGEKPTFSTIKFVQDGDDHEDVFGRALRWLAEYLQVDRPDAIYIEAPLSPGIHGQTNADTTLRLIGMWAALAAAVKVKGIKYRRAKVSTVRKEFIGHGNLKGHEAKRRVREMCRLLDWQTRNDNESDAGAIFWWASTREALNLAPVITPMMQQQCANIVGGADMSDAIFSKVKSPKPKGVRVSGAAWKGFGK